MNLITLTLTLTPQQVIEVIQVLDNTSSEAHNLPVETLIDSTDTMSPENTTTSSTPIIITPTAGKKTIMPAFGRTQSQVDNFTKEEQEKFDNKTEEDLLKEERRAEHTIKKIAKETLQKDKETELAKEQDIINDIKAKVTDISTTKLPVCPWPIS